MSGRPWYKRYPRDYIDGVTGMGLELTGAYSIVLDLLYARGGPIPFDDRWLAGLFGCSKQAARRVIDGLISRCKLSLVDGMLSNARAEVELEVDQKLTESLAKAGRNGGTSRAERDAAAREISGLGQARLKHTRAKDTDTDTEASSAHVQAQERAHVHEAGSGAVPKPGAVPGGLASAVSLAVMKSAHMVMPPDDLPLVEAWLSLGAVPERDIYPVVERLTAKQGGRPIRMFRYFDGAVRDAVKAAGAQDDADVEYFENVSRRYAAMGAG